jgi:hypothetical protein
VFHSLIAVTTITIATSIATAILPAGGWKSA